MTEAEPPVPQHMSHIQRDQRWLLPSGATVSVRRIFYSYDDGEHCATVRRVTNDNTLEMGSFEVLLSLIARKGTKQK